jgi:hypothetical protein
LEIVNGRDSSGDVGIDGRIILKHLKEMKGIAGLIWLRSGTNSGLL